MSMRLIQSVIILEINKIGRHEVLLPINHKYKKVCDILDFSRLIKYKKFRQFFC